MAAGFSTALAIVCSFSIAVVNSNDIKAVKELLSPYDSYNLPELPFAFDDLEPYIDGETIRVHYNGHHESYRQKMNLALLQFRKDASSTLQSFSIIEILQNLEKIPNSVKLQLRNNGGGFVNHIIYWTILSPNPSGAVRLPSSQLLDEIETTFGSFGQFKSAFTDQATKLFGSGYVWLCRDSVDGSLSIETSAYQDTPLSRGLNPILVIDVWEHAYYLKHMNKRPNYVTDWWHVVNWQAVENLDDFWTELSYSSKATKHEL